MQETLFHEDFREALAHTVKALGGLEAVGADLWPTKTRSAAKSWLSDCLNSERPAKLDLDDITAILRMAREKGIHTAFYFLCDDATYERPRPVDAEAQEAQVANQIERAVSTLDTLMKRYERIKQVGKVQLVG